jgi:hypothetical protein
VTVRGPELTASASAPSIRNSRCCANDPANGAADAMAAFFTEASALTRSSMSLLNRRNRSGVCCWSKLGACRLSTRSSSNPGLTA